MDRLIEKLKIDCSLISNYLVEFVRQEITKTGLTKAVIGLSGGIDSSLVAYIAKEALGKNNVYGILMPYKLSSKESIDDALKVVEDTGINHKIVEITKAADAYLENFEEINNVRRGNVLARMRMIVLFDHSSAYGGLVVGTSNKTELLLGYGTWYGDMASSLNPIGDLYKNQIYQLARYFNLPENIIKKKPSADLWVGQSDEDELGFSYDEADIILYHLFDLRWSIDEVVKLGFSKDLVEGIAQRVRKNQFKRLPPIIAKISTRTINIDFRYLRDWGM
ncbi:NAD+ synthase [Hippea jasoniae]|uniref:NAD+ synthase n=1 Tax=Hippea jasoniae TaxID=944479 RepID=UPI00054E6866|nr:NAD+ synthase [Hippea jasoniae]